MSAPVTRVRTERPVMMRLMATIAPVHLAGRALTAKQVRHYQTQYALYSNKSMILMECNLIDIVKIYKTCWLKNICMLETLYPFHPPEINIIISDHVGHVSANESSCYILAFIFIGRDRVHMTLGAPNKISANERPLLIFSFLLLRLWNKTVISRLDTSDIPGNLFIVVFKLQSCQKRFNCTDVSQITQHVTYIVYID